MRSNLRVVFSAYVREAFFSNAKKKTLGGKTRRCGALRRPRRHRVPAPALRRYPRAEPRQRPLAGARLPGESANRALWTHQLREGRVPWAVDASVRLRSVWQSNLSFVKPCPCAHKKREERKTFGHNESNVDHIWNMLTTSGQHFVETMGIFCEIEIHCCD